MIICEKFSLRSLVAWYLFFCGTSEKSFLWKNLYFPPICESFFSQKFSAIRYIFTALLQVLQKFPKQRLASYEAVH